MDIRIINALGFLVDEYGFNCKAQIFEDKILTFSYYNSHGCFTVCIVPVINEITFYRTDKFSTEYKQLCAYEKSVNVQTLEPEIWAKHSKIRCFRRPFFWESHRRITACLAEALKVHISREGEFFGIRVEL